MPLTLSWQEIAIRLTLSAVAGALIGFDRGERGRPAGLRTTLLVCLAAAIAMIQTNLLLPTAGKTGSSFAVLDLMRLPLGILTGMGFIGGGAILRHEGFVLGVTTAATLWFVTVMGLCFGGGQIALGTAALAIGLVVLSGLRWFERRMKQEQRAILSLTTEVDSPSEEEIRGVVRQSGYEIASSATSFLNEPDRREFEFRLRWRARPGDQGTPPLLKEFGSNPHVLSARWKPAEADH